MLQIFAQALMVASRLDAQDERVRDQQAAARTRCRRAIAEDGFAAARMRGACPD